MKKQIIIIFAIIISMAMNGQAAIKTVSNNTGSPGQYTNLQTAIDAAGFYDTILVAGSATSYGNITFGKPLVLIGAGYNNPYGMNTTLGQIELDRQTFYVSSSNTKIIGFIVTGNIIFYPYYSGGTNMTIDNVVIERCRIGSVDFGLGQGGTHTYNNDSIRNCLIEGNINSHGVYNSHYYNNVVIHNNIFNGGYFTFGYNCSPNNTCNSDLNKFYVKNNLFLNKTTNCFNNCVKMVIENNIFYGAEPQGGTGCVFTRNLTYMCLNNIIPGTDNLGSGNRVNQNPLFVNVPPQGGFSFSYDYHLQATSPGKNAGTDGSDIGIYGGMMPFEVGANPYVPQMMTTTLPSGSSVPAGGTLNVQFTARKQN